MADKYPVVTLTGPRQSGKTTLVRSVFSNKPYVNLEKPDIRNLAQNDPNSFLQQYPDGAIIDEFQNVPELSSYIQVIVDEKSKNNMFILTGSRQLEIMDTVSQSLAGRTAVLKLLPFSITEMTRGYKKTEETDNYIFKGFYPRLHEQNIPAAHFYSDYLQTYVERDVRKILQVKNLSLFERFIRLCAGRTGQLLNLNSLASDTGINHTTAREWMSILEASFIIYLLPPWFKNMGKRLVKSPKLYFYDTGFASNLLGINQSEQIFTHPLRGSLFENLVIMETVKHLYNRGYRHPLYFYRDSNGVELDLLFPRGGNWIPIEIKSSATLTDYMFKNLRLVQASFPDFYRSSILSYDGKEEYTSQNTRIVNFKNLNRIIETEND